MPPAYLRMRVYSQRFSSFRAVVLKGERLYLEEKSAYILELLL